VEMPANESVAECKQTLLSARRKAELASLVQSRKAHPAKLRPHQHPPGQSNCRIDILMLELSTQVANVRHSEPRPIHTVLVKCAFSPNQQATSCILLNSVEPRVTLSISRRGC